MHRTNRNRQSWGNHNENPWANLGVSDLGEETLENDSVPHHPGFDTAYAATYELNINYIIYICFFFLSNNIHMFEWKKKA